MLFRSNLYDTYQSINDDNYQECYHDATQFKERAFSSSSCLLRAFLGVFVGGGSACIRTLFIFGRNFLRGYRDWETIHSLLEKVRERVGRMRILFLALFWAGTCLGQFPEDAVILETSEEGETLLLSGKERDLDVPREPASTFKTVIAWSDSF